MDEYTKTVRINTIVICIHLVRPHAYTIILCESEGFSKNLLFYA